MILLVEDNPLVLTITSRILDQAGYNVLRASNSGEALLLCEQHNTSVDLLLSDVVMPYMSGPELLTRLHPLQPNMRALFMTGHNEDTTGRHGLTPHHNILFKPCRPETLLSRIQTLLT